jgi:hypothetical protein
VEAAAVAGLLALALAAYAQAGPATVVLDRTLICTPEYGNVDVMASPRGDVAFSTARMESSGYLAVGSGQAYEADGLVLVRARAEKSRVGSSRGPQGVYARAGRCFLSKRKIPLDSKGLVGPPVQWAKSYGCSVPGRVIVRVRAVLAAGATWRRANDSFFGARANVVSAQLAARSERTGKPLAYSTLGPAGKTKLWSAQSCL